MASEGRRAAIIVDEKYFVSRRRAAVAHSRRACRHAGDVQPFGLWLFSKQFFDIASGHVAFDKVSADLGRMARSHCQWHTQADLMLGHLLVS